jgi:drug/metabolite transporter (DMT)-like permease
VDARLLRLFALAGAIFAAIRLSILAALRNAGPIITAAITPVTPVATLCLALLLGMEVLRPRTRAGAAQVRRLGGSKQCETR